MLYGVLVLFLPKFMAKGPPLPPQSPVAQHGEKDGIWGHKEAALCVSCQFVNSAAVGVCANVSFLHTLCAGTPGSITIPRNSGAGQWWGGTSSTLPVCPALVCHSSRMRMPNSSLQSWMVLYRMVLVRP